MGRRMAATVDRITVERMAVDRITVDKITVERMTVERMAVERMAVESRKAKGRAEKAEKERLGVKLAMKSLQRGVGWRRRKVMDTRGQMRRATTNWYVSRSHIVLSVS